MSMGSTARWSTSRSRKSPSVRFNWSDFFIIESNDLILSLSRYSYDQYHCRPIALMEVWGFGISSIRYRRRSDGRARNTRISAGRIVHTVSRVFASRSWREVNLETMSLISI